MLTHSKTRDSDYKLYSDGRFVIKGYNEKRPFSNFLPGISGVYGTPMWVFYVNRGQGIASFGTRNKDNAILEFFPANKAYQNVTWQGFRTFVKILHKDKFSYYEPFRETSHSGNQASVQTMEISSHELVVRDTDKARGLETTVTAFTVPDEALAVLAREVKITNISHSAMEIEVLDGLPSVNPYGMNEFFIKHMSRTIEAWMVAENLSKKAPFLRLKVDATDRPEVEFIEEGNFFFSVSQDKGAKAKLLEPLIDPAKVFGPVLDFSYPKVYCATSTFRPPHDQIAQNKTPCAFSFTTLKLAPGQSKSFYSYYGHAKNVDLLNRYTARAKKPGYFEEKRIENKQTIDQIKSRVFTISSNIGYDLYCGQTYLDNIMRGGFPIQLGEKNSSNTFYVYSRKHGDLERDYNRFLVEPTYFSQGDGNYRDVNQNRRSDVWFDPRVKDVNVRTFLNLVQLDGFNPLVLKGLQFHLRMTKESKRALGGLIKGKLLAETETFLEKPFAPGEFYRFLEERKAATPKSFAQLMARLAPYLEREERAEHGEGFWTDHWMYNLDLVESYLSIYPENWRELLFGKNEFTFYDNAHRVMPRCEKYFLKKQGVVRQYQAVKAIKEKSRLIASRSRDAHVVRTRQGRGEVYKTTLFVKLLCLFTNKFASLDPRGVGIEMEAEKPSWYDALNGLPGLFGSSLPETFELKRLSL
ncbi:MAG TPA: cellobiose phosphorylase, partial [Candidatus Omnitrophota bacterium]|nr:cellobiose phosphorylase [Candidatus Omnitrophota bacterium]